MERCSGKILGEQDGGGGLRGYPFASAEKSQAVSCRRLDAYSTHVEGKDFTEAQSHGISMRPNLGCFAYQGDVDMSDGTPLLPNKFGGMGEKIHGVGASPLRVAGWEVGANIASSNSAQ